MQKFSREIVNEVLAANDIVDVIGAYVDLKPAGTGRFKALCPFHQEKTPSFFVSRDRQSFYCFGCQKGGDALAYLSEQDGLSFLEGLQKLADRAGIKLPEPSRGESPDEYRRAQLLKLAEFASAHYKKVLNDPLKGSVGRQYLKTRQLKPETIERFALGFAVDDWSNLSDAARAAGFKEAVLEASGLARRGERGSLYDFFRNRLMIPIRDTSGNVVAFGGRDLGNAAAKYINSPENQIYKKSRVLYGVHEAREAIRKEKCAVLVEGYFDALRCFDAGIDNVVATCGTALTPGQAALIRRYAPEIVVVFDADPAGIRAALRGIGILTAGGLRVRALVLPDGKDPDDYIKAHGPEAFGSLLENALDFVTFYVRTNAERLTTIEGRTDVARELFTILLGIQDQLRRDEYLKRLAAELRLNEWAVRAEFGRFLQSVSTDRTTAQPEMAAASRNVSQDDVDFIAILLTSEPHLQTTKEALAGLELPEGALAEVLHTVFAGVGPDVHLRLSTQEARTLFAAAASQDTLRTADADALVRKRIVRLKKEVLLTKASRIQEAIEEAERSHNTEKVVTLLSEKMGINREIEEVGVA